MILKRITVPQVTEIAASMPETEPSLSLEEINTIVHEVRKQKLQE